MAVLPSDQFIAKAAAYRRVVRAALQVAAQPGALVVLGIPPTRPETGYGYIERGAAPAAAVRRRGPVYAVRRFTEKPSLSRARSYIRTGHILLERRHVFLARFHLDGKSASAICRKRMRRCCASPKPSAPALCRHAAPHLPQLENISIDYAVLEPASRDPGRSPSSSSPPT